MIHELRHYIPVKGKEELMLQRIKTQSGKLLADIGMRVVKEWMPADGSGELWYILEYDSMEQRERLYETFINHPEWKRIKAETEKEGPLYEKINVYLLEPTNHFQRT
jgi:hypothetical protein